MTGEDFNISFHLNLNLNLNPNLNKTLSVDAKNVKEEVSGSCGHLSASIVTPTASPSSSTSTITSTPNWSRRPRISTCPSSVNNRGSLEITGKSFGQMGFSKSLDWSGASREEAEGCPPTKASDSPPKLNEDSAVVCEISRVSGLPRSVVLGLMEEGVELDPECFRSERERGVGSASPSNVSTLHSSRSSFQHPFGLDRTNLTPASNAWAGAGTGQDYISQQHRLQVSHSDCHSALTSQSGSPHSDHSGPTPTRSSPILPFPHNQSDSASSPGSSHTESTPLLGYFQIHPSLRPSFQYFGATPHLNALFHAFTHVVPHWRVPFGLVEVPWGRTQGLGGGLKIEGGGGVGMESGSIRANMPQENLFEHPQLVAIRAGTMAPDGRMKWALKHLKRVESFGRGSKQDFGDERRRRMSEMRELEDMVGGTPHWKKHRPVGKIKGGTTRKRKVRVGTVAVPASGCLGERYFEASLREFSSHILRNGKAISGVPRLRSAVQDGALNVLAILWGRRRNIILQLPVFSISLAPRAWREAVTRFLLFLPHRSHPRHHHQLLSPVPDRSATLEGKCLALWGPSVSIKTTSRKERLVWTFQNGRSQAANFSKLAIFSLSACLDASACHAVSMCTLMVIVVLVLFLLWTYA